MVMSIALIGLIGAASAGISSYTDIRGTHFSSVSRTSVSGTPVNIGYAQSFQAEMAVPGYTRDFSNTNLNLAGTDYSLTSSIRSAPTRNSVSTTIANPSDVTGTMTRQNCALLGQGIKLETTLLPQPITVPATSRWQGEHPAGYAYPAHSTERYMLNRP